MSWAEVKKINTDSTLPLNLLTSLLYISMCGNNFDPIQDIDTTIALLRSNLLYSNTIAMCTIFEKIYDYILNSTAGVGVFLNKAFLLNCDSANSCENYESFIANDEACVALNSKNKFFKPMLYFTPDLMAGLLGSDYKLLNNSRQTLLTEINNSNNSKWYDLIRESGLAKYWAYNWSEYFLARGDHSYISDFSGLCIISAIGAGSDGSIDSGTGGAGGVYLQKLYNMPLNKEIDASISTTGTLSTALGISLGKGGGAASGQTPAQEGVILTVSKGGATDSYWSTPGGGGYGGGAGGSGRYGGGTGGGTLPIVDGTGGDGGTGSTNAGKSGVGGGGGGGSYTATSGNFTSAYASGGGGGYGGGGGGTASTATNAAGKGGSGGIVIFH